MPRDHYVAQTYLRHFADRGTLHVYRKADDQYRARSPKSVCHQWDGDLIPDFLKNEKMLGDYRAIFEPRWNDAITDLNNGICDAAVKAVISGYWANLMVCTPAWTRVAIKMLDFAAMQRLRAEDVLRSEAGRPDPKIKDMRAAFESGRYRIATEPNAARAMAARKLIQFAWSLYNADWSVIRNDTGTGFLTSDNPVAFHDVRNWGQPGLPRYLTLSPRVCLYGDMGRAAPRDEPDFTQPPRGKVQWGSVPLAGVERVNRAIAECAEEIVISSSKSDAVRTLVTMCARYRVDMEFIEIRQRDGFLVGSHVRVREQATSAS